MDIHKQIICIKFETDIYDKAFVTTPDVYANWIVNSHLIQLLKHVEVNYLENDTYKRTLIEVDEDEDRIDWEYRRIPDLSQLHGEIAFIRLIKLSQE